MREIKINKSLRTGNIAELCECLELYLEEEGEIVLDFIETDDSDIKEMTSIMTICMQLRKRGGIIRVKNLPFILKGQFLLSGLNHAVDEIYL